MLSSPSQVLVRNEELFAEGKWLLANPTDSDIFAALGDIDVSGFHQYFDVYQDCLRTQPEERQSYAAQLSTDTQFDGIVLYLPKAKAHAKMLLANLACCVKPGGQLLLVGENKGGIKSAAKLMEPYGDRVNKLDSARHCSLFCVQVDAIPPEFKLEDWQLTLEVSVNGQSYPIVSLPGVFSHGELDAGTRLLLENVDKVPMGPVLDFACGAGVIGCYLGLTNPEITLSMSDVNALALHCAQASAELNQIPAKVIASNGLGEITGTFRAVYTNPPFHTGIQTDYSVTESFIRELNQHLSKEGELWLVANRFLKYPDLLAREFAQFSTRAQTSKFNLYHSRKH